MKLRTIVCKAFMRVKRRLIRNSPLILGGMAVGAFGYSLYSAIKASPKAEEIRRTQPDDMNEIDKFCEIAPVYSESVGFALAGTALLFGSLAIGQRRYTHLLANYILLDQSYKTYQRQVKERYGSDEEAEIRKEIIEELTQHPIPEEDEVLFYDFNSRRYFTDTLLHVRDTEYAYNNYYALNDVVDWNKFYELLDHSDMPPTEEGAYAGYSIDYLYLDHGTNWIDFRHEHTTLDDGMECIIISTPIPPSETFMWERK